MVRLQAEHKMNAKKIAIFVDVENLTHWVKTNGPERLISEMSVTGQSIVRRAYGNWANPNLQQLQIGLTQQGFELIHNYHPVSGKNSSDIQLTIDVMEHALRIHEVEWIVLATGDSDFSPLFRKLREMGKEVVGVGPRSSLSESVKTSCSKYIYTESVLMNNAEVLHSALDDAVDLVEKAFSAFDSPVSCSALKVAMINIDSAFDEKSLGYKSFTDFLKNIDSIKLHFDSDSCVWTVYPSSSYPSKSIGAKVSSNNHVQENTPSSVEDLYRHILRKKNWRAVPKSLLIEVYKRILGLGAQPKATIKDVLIQAAIPETTSTDINKAISIFFKAHLFRSLDTDNLSEKPQDERLFQLIHKTDFIRDIDFALLMRLLLAIQEGGMQENRGAIKSILYGEYGDSELEQLLSDAREHIKLGADQEPS